MAEQRSEKTKENKHGAVIAGCIEEGETLLGLKIEVLVHPIPFNYRFASTIRCKMNRILKMDHFVNYCFSKINFLND